MHRSSLPRGERLQNYHIQGDELRFRNDEMLKITAANAGNAAFR